MTKIRVPSDRLRQIYQDGDDIDNWLRENIGYGNYKEWIALVNLPYRSFEIYDDQHALLFRMKWL